MDDESKNRALREAGGLLAGITYQEQISVSSRDIFSDLIEALSDSEAGMDTHHATQETPGSLATQLSGNADTSSGNTQLAKKGFKDWLLSTPATDCNNACLTSCWTFAGNCYITGEKQPDSPQESIHHWIKYHAVTTVQSRLDTGVLWLCPEVTCTAHFLDRESLLNHIQSCSFSGFPLQNYWCNQHAKFERASKLLPRGKASTSRHTHNKENDGLKYDDWEVVYYKRTQMWPVVSWDGIEMLEPTDDGSQLQWKDKSRKGHIECTGTGLEDLAHHFMLKSNPWNADDSTRDFQWAFARRFDNQLYERYLESARIEQRVQKLIRSCRWRRKYWVRKSFLDFLGCLEGELCDHPNCGHLELYCRATTMNSQCCSKSIRVKQPFNSYELTHRSFLNNLIQEITDHFESCHLERSCTASDIAEIRDVAHSPKVSKNLSEFLLRCQKLCPGAPTCSTMNSWALEDEGRYIRPCLTNTTEGVYQSSNLPSRRQWESLRDVRRFFKDTHSRIIPILAKASKAEVLITRLRKQCSSALDFLSTGILTFKNILHDKVPSSFKEVLAFICLSDSIAKVLMARNIWSHDQNYLSELGKWRRAIDGDSERSIFDSVAGTLWPEAYNNLMEKRNTPPKSGSIESPATPSTPPFEDLSEFLKRSDLPFNVDLLAELLPAFVSSTEELQSLSYVPPQSEHAEEIEPTAQLNEAPISFEEHYHFTALPSDIYEPLEFSELDRIASFQKPIKGLFEATASNVDLHFEDFLNLSQIYPPASPSTIHRPPIESGHSQSASLNENVSLEFSPDESSSLLNGDRPSWSTSSVLDQSQTTTEDSFATLLHTLLATLIFQAVVQFLTYMSAIGNLLQVLSGSSSDQTSHRTMLRGASLTHERFFDLSFKIIIYLLTPLRSMAMPQLVRNITYPTEALLKAGYFNCLHEVELYLLELGKFLDSSFSTYTSLVTAVLENCASAAKHLASENISCYCSDYQVQYEQQYIETRCAEELGRSQNPPSPALAKFNTSEPSVGFIAAKTVVSTNDQIALFTAAQSPSVPSCSVVRALTQTPNANTTPDIVPPAETDLANESSETQWSHCNRCSAKFSGPYAKGNLKKHVHSIHLNMKKECPFKCGHRARQDNLRIHCRKKHPGRVLPDWLAPKRSFGGGGHSRKNAE